MLVIAYVFFLLGNCESLHTRVIIGAFRFFVVGGNRESNIGNCVLTLALLVAHWKWVACIALVSSQCIFQ